jgi:L-lactate dehydrogenase complex protein LldG
MTGDAREEILRRIRIATGRGAATAETPRHYRPVVGAGSVDLFVERLRDYRATVHRVGRDDLSNKVGECFERRGATRIVAPTGVPAEWLGATTAAVLSDLPTLSFIELDGVDGVITSCSVAIAETGTIVLTHGDGEAQGRRAVTLVPDYHLVVVFETQIVFGVPDAIAALDATQTMTWISGPSATSDIELQRVEGVHGPRSLEVVVVGGRPSDHPELHSSADVAQSCS